jgi:hypothetical protein
MGTGMNVKSFLEFVQILILSIIIRHHCLFPQKIGD